MGRVGDEPVVVAAMTRGLAFFRPLALAYTSLLAWHDRHGMNRPEVAVAVLGALAAWTIVMAFRRRITWTTVGVDLTLAVLGVLATGLAYPGATVLAGALTLPGIWAASGVVGAAILGGPRTGLLAALTISVADLVSVRRPNFGTIHNIVLIFLIGSLIGLAARLARESQRHLEASLRAEEAYAERERLSRVVHDGVLQTLSYVNRRGRELGAAGVELAEMAADQERSLRALVTVGRTISPNPVTEDLTARLRALGGAGVEVNMPAEPIVMPAQRAEELANAVRAALDNVRDHAGADAQAWVLVEDLGQTVEITVRDNGAGMPPDRLDEAAAAGRLGVASSIRGRARDLGGEAVWQSAPGRGCTVSLRVPKELQPLARPKGVSR